MLSAGRVEPAERPARRGQGRRGPVLRPARRRLWLAGAVIVAALGYLAFEGLSSSVVYFKTVNEAVADRAQLGGTDFRLEGTVVRGSVRPTSGGVDFALTAGGRTLDVQSANSPPQLFAGGIPVVVVGHFAGGTDRFFSDTIMVKHSSSYVAAHPDRVKGDPGQGRGS
ncbi:MAG: cytochrome c maturation protein CcmE, partial [Acidimicrobiales bacterium]